MEHLGADLDQPVEGILGQRLRMLLQEALQRLVHQGAALGRAGIGVQRVERPELQNLAGIERVAHP